MDKEKLIKHLQELAEYCEKMKKVDSGNIWHDGSEALQIVVKELSTECDGDDTADILREILLSEGLTQQQLADKTGTSRQNISQMLTRVSSMKFSNFRKVLDVLGYEAIVRKKSAGGK